MQAFIDASACKHRFMDSFRRWGQEKKSVNIVFLLFLFTFFVFRLRPSNCLNQFPLSSLFREICHKSANEPNILKYFRCGQVTIDILQVVHARRIQAKQEPSSAQFISRWSSTKVHAKTKSYICHMIIIV